MEQSGKSGMARAKLFWNGRSQAVRLPKEYRFEGDEVSIRREGDAVILEPVPQLAWPTGFWEWVDTHQDELTLGGAEPVDLELEEPDLDGAAG